MTRTLFLLLPLLPLPLLAQQQPEDEVFLFQEVEVKPRLLTASPLFYPQAEQATGGSVTTLYVIDTLGAVDPRSIKITTSPSPGFTAAVRASLLGQRYSPGLFRRLRVRVLTQTTIRFRPGVFACDSLIQFEGTALCAGSTPDLTTHGRRDGGG